MYNILKWLMDKENEVFESNRKESIKTATSYAVFMVDAAVLALFSWGLGDMIGSIINFIRKKK